MEGGKKDFFPFALFPYYLHNDISKALYIPGDTSRQFKYHSVISTVEHSITEIITCKREYILYSSPI